MAAADGPALHPIVRLGIGLVVSAVALYLATRRVSVREVTATFGSLDVRLLLAAFLVFAARVCAAALRWTVLTADTRDGWWRRSGRNVLVGFALNNTLPARAGDAARMWMSDAQTGRGFVHGAVLVVIEKAGDVLALGVLAACAAVAAFAPGVASLAFACVALALAVAAPTALAVSRERSVSSAEVADVPDEGGRIARFARTFMAGVRTIGGRRALAVAWWSMVVWALEGATYWLIALAAGVRLTLPAAGSVVGLGNLAGIVPALPGAWGTFELAVQQVLVAFGHEAAAAFGLGLIIHLAVFIPPTVAGAVISGPALLSAASRRADR